MWFNNKLIFKLFNIFGGDINEFDIYFILCIYILYIIIIILLNTKRNLLILILND